MSWILHTGDLPADFGTPKSIAVDTETMGLHPHRDRLCLVQVCAGDGVAHLVHFTPETGYAAPNLKSLLANPAVEKIFHYARFDMGVLSYYLDVMPGPVFCTKIASKLVRTFSERHGLKNLCKDLLNVDLSKEEQRSDWGAPVLKDSQMVYAAQDVLYLHDLQKKCRDLLEREGRMALAESCFAFLPTRVQLDLLGWLEIDIFSHA